MNFLAHLHLAHLAESSLSGNLLADFVRGNPEESFPPDVVAGIHMHRRIDVLTDNLPEVREAREWFRSETRRVAPITLDVMWDHFLSRHWSQLSITPCVTPAPSSADKTARSGFRGRHNERLNRTRSHAGHPDVGGGLPCRLTRSG